MKPSPPLAEWCTVAEAVDWLNAETGIEWDWRRVLGTLKELYPETVHVVPPLGLPVAKPDESGRLDSRTWQCPMLMQASRADEYLQQLLLGDSLYTATGYTGALVEPRAGWRAIPTEPIPARALRLSRQEVYVIAENADGFDVLLAELRAGKHPELAALLDERDSAKSVVSEEPAGPAPASPISERAARLAAVVEEVETRAREQGYPFDRTRWPGTKREFRKFLERHDPRLAYTLPADDGNLNDEMRPHGVKFASPGRATDKGLKFYRALFPEYPA